MFYSHLQMETVNHLSLALLGGLYTVTNIEHLADVCCRKCN